MKKEKSFNVSHWGGYAHCYDALNALKPYQELQQRVVASLDLVPGRRLLDAACGTGNLAWWINKGGGLNGAEFVGIDFSDEMVARAGEKCSGAAASFIKTDLNASLPFGDGMFDQVASINTLYALADPAKALAEFWRVLKPGGSITLVNPKKGYENGLVLKAHCGDKGSDGPWLQIHASAEKERAAIRRAVADPDVMERLIAVGEFNRKIAADRKFHFLAQSVLAIMCRQAGFSNLHVEKTYAGQGIFLTGSKETAI